MAALATTEELCISLIREFLAAKGFSGTLLKLDEENPKSETSLISEQQLAKALNMDIARSSDSGANRSKSTLLESLVSEQAEDKPMSSSSRLRGDARRKGMLADNKYPPTRTPTYFISQPLDARPTPTGIGARHKPRLHAKTVKTEGPLPDFLRDKDEKMEYDELNPFRSIESNGFKPSKRKPRSSTPEIALRPASPRSSSHSKESTFTMSSNTSRYSSGSKVDGKHSHSSRTQRKESLQCEDVELSLEQSSSVGLRNMPIISTYRPPDGVPISTEQAQELREILFGSVRGTFNKEWLQQNLVFSDVPKLEFGLVQHKGGPCGVLASLQAHVLKHLLFTDDTSPDLATCPTPKPEARCDALVQALTEIIWRAGGKSRAVVATLSPDSSKRVMKIGGLLAGSDIITKIILHYFTSERSLMEFIRYSLNEKFVNSDSSGCISFTLSVILSRGVLNVRGDMDDSKSTLIGFHSYCTQELVNLMLTGYATSNIFDGEMCLGGTGPDKVILRGIKDPTEVGQLSLFEHYGSCKVGDHYKNPKYPIFVVCCESHFVVLFALIKSLTQTKHLQNKFDLYFYDGLANQKDVIRLTVQLDSAAEFKNEDLAPPIELCINTKWRSKIEWNGSEQLL